MNAPLLPGFNVAPPTALVPAAVATPRAMSPVKPPTPPAPGRLEMSPTYFRAMLSPRERAAVAVRRRFHSMPWLRRADGAGDDDLP